MTNNPIERLRELKQEFDEIPPSFSGKGSTLLMLINFRANHFYEIFDLANDLAQALTDCQGELEESKNSANRYFECFAETTKQLVTTQESIAKRDELIKSILRDLWTDRFTPVGQRYNKFNSEYEQLKSSENGGEDEIHKKTS